MNYLLVFVGGGLGSMARYSIGTLLSKNDLDFPLATLIANFLASLILGFFLAQFLVGNSSDFKKFLVMTGFCGGFSTFSTFSAETFQLFQAGNYSFAFLNIALSILICLAGIFLGFKIAG